VTRRSGKSSDSWNSIPENERAALVVDALGPKCVDCGRDLTERTTQRDAGGARHCRDAKDCQRFQEGQVSRPTTF